jgi:hypothetical protein
MRNLKSSIVRCAFLLTALALLIWPQVGGQTRQRRSHVATAARSSATSAPQQPKFKLDCPVPALTPGPLSIDKRCDNDGDSSGDSAKQNEIKNRFCLPGSPTNPIEITFDTLKDLQTAAETKGIHFGRVPIPGQPGKDREDLPQDRSLLLDMVTVNGQQVGEGSLVTLEGFVFKAKHSNVGKGESVNCHFPKLGDNDIHIALARTKNGAKTGADECKTVTAEITPHHRSAIYNRFDTDPRDFLNGKPQKPGKDKIKGSPLPLHAARVRITGQLFFDGSHSPCGSSIGGRLLRSSSWEIHPVFEIEVFEKPQNKFIALADWVQLHSN